MACTVRRAVQLEVSVNTKNQTREQVHALVDELLRQQGIVECGIMGYFSLALGHNSDAKLGAEPDGELKKRGAIALRSTELH